MEDKPKFAKSEYEQKNERDKSNEELKSSELKPTKVAYATVVRTTAEDLAALKRDLQKCFERHQAVVIRQRVSTEFLEIVEKPWPNDRQKASKGEE